MDESPLQEIPAELRNRIAELALYEPDGVEIKIASGRSTCRNPPSLPSVCRQLREETYKMYFAVNEFTIYTDCLEIELKYGPIAARPRAELVAAVVKCLSSMGHENVKRSASFTLHLSEYDFNDNNRTNTYFDRVWGTIAGGYQGLISRRGPVLSIRQFDLAFSAIIHYEQAHTLRYRFPYGNDQQETVRCLHITRQVAQDSIDLPDEDGMRECIADEHGEICGSILERW
ncbi:hypothetical protein LTR10_000946 [Elasticomyces elasticus]|nr:hypothetical protein LTR10_000946 [Elasticomyces elasticus]KAK4979805.1 hypothetical protein LTR42_000112 [Elasticomyces elasticus]